MCRRLLMLLISPQMSVLKMTILTSIFRVLPESPSSTFEDDSPHVKIVKAALEHCKANGSISSKENTLVRRFWMVSLKYQQFRPHSSTRLFCSISWRLVWAAFRTTSFCSICSVSSSKPQIGKLSTKQKKSLLPVSKRSEIFMKNFLKVKMFQ